MKSVVSALKALADENRIKIVNILSKKDMCVCDIIDNLNLSQPAVSHHLKILSSADIIQGKKTGKWIYYTLNKDYVKDIIKNLEEVM